MAWYGWILIGVIIGSLTATTIILLLLRDRINVTEINTKRIVQKKNENSSQDVTSEISQKKYRTTWLEKIKAKRALKKEGK